LLKGYLFVLVAAVCWGIFGPVAKIAFAEGVTPMEAAFWRTVLTWMLFAAMAVVTGRWRVALGDVPMMLMFGVFGVAGLYGSSVLAVKHGGAALASVLLYTAPAWVALMSFVVLREAMTRAKLMAVGMTVAGVVMVSFGQGAGVVISPTALIFGLISGFSYALFFIFGKQFLGNYHTQTMFLYAMPAGALTLLPFTDLSMPTAKGAAAVTCMAVVSTFVALLVYSMGLKLLEATRAAVVATLEPVVAALLAYVMFGEVFGVLGYLGAAIILGAVLLTVLETRRSIKPVQRAAVFRRPRLEIRWKRR